MAIILYGYPKKGKDTVFVMCDECWSITYDRLVELNELYQERTSPISKRFRSALED